MVFLNLGFKKSAFITFWNGCSKVFFYKNISWSYHGNISACFIKLLNFFFSVPQNIQYCGRGWRVGNFMFSEGWGHMCGGAECRTRKSEEIFENFYDFPEDWVFLLVSLPPSSLARARSIVFERFLRSSVDGVVFTDQKGVTRFLYTKDTYVYPFTCRYMVFHAMGGASSRINRTRY